MFSLLFIEVEFIRFIDSNQRSLTETNQTCRLSNQPSKRFHPIALRFSEMRKKHSALTSEEALCTFYVSKSAMLTVL